MLVSLPQGVLTRGVVEGASVRGLIGRDHFFAAAAVAGEAVAGQQGVRRQELLRHQGIDQSDEAAGVAAGHGDAAAVTDRLGPLHGKLREAVDPARGRSVRRGGVQHHNSGILYHIGRFHGRRVRQAQKRHIAAVERVAAGLRVLALRLRQHVQL